MSTLNPAFSGARLMQRLDALARFSSEGPDRLTRLYLTAEHRAAAEQLGAWMREAGLAVTMDAAGTLIGRLEGATQDAPVLLLGSHIDTVRNAGKYDGNLGVLVAIEAVGQLRASGTALAFAIEVLAFGDEEGVRFAMTLAGSRALAGSFDPASLDGMDAAGINLRDALRGFGCDPASIPALARDRAKVLGYIEVHIEQGPVLEEKGLALGIVTAISGASRLAITVTGMAGHAGTVPMRLRRDAGMAAAQMLLAAERIAVARENIVATTGRFSLQPGAVNVIPGQADFSLDLRSPDDSARRAALVEMTEAFDAIARLRGVAVTSRPFYDEAAAACDPALMRDLERAVAAQGIVPFRLPSGAGHDGLAMAALCPIAMMFVRCKGGISHNPSESVESGDVRLAMDVLAQFLARFDPLAFRASHHGETA